MIVCKFGGTSVSDTISAKNIKKIVSSNPNRHIIVFSAIGKNKQYFKKVTDELYECFFIYQQNKSTSKSLLLNIFNKYKYLANTLNVKFGFNKEFNRIISLINQNKLTKEYLVSRGEYLSALLFSKYLGFKFLDASKYIIFNNNGKFNYALTKARLNTLNKNKKYCIGGFYGGTKKGDIKIFPRGGSDITGAIIAKALNAEIYENYTDVDGVYNKNPNIFSNAVQLPFLNYKTAYQMADAGNEVVHKTALNFLKDSNTVLIVKNTRNSNYFGTVLVCTNYLFNDIYVCLSTVYILEVKELDNLKLEKIKQYSNVKKTIFHNSKYYVIFDELYVNKEKLLSINLKANLYNAYMFTIFCNNKFDKNHIKKLKILQKKLKNAQILSKYLSYKNNFIVLCLKENYNKVVQELNKYLQK